MADVNARPEMLESAWSAMRQRQWEPAVGLWQDLRERYPDEVAGWTQAAQALRELGRRNDADALLAQAIPQFPHNGDPAVLYAFIAMDRRDWTEAAVRWAAFRERFPDQLMGWHHAAVCLREAGRPAELEALLLAGSQHFPDDIRLNIEYATLPQLTRDFDAALARLEAIRDRFIDQPDVLLAEAHLYRHFMRNGDTADAKLAEAMARFPQDARPFIDFAWCADQYRRPTAEILRRWRLAFDRFPDHVGVVTGITAALEHAGASEEADRIRVAAIERLPEYLDLALHHARAAAKDPAAAIPRWDAVIARFPTQAVAWEGKGLALRDLGRIDEAETLLATAVERFPESAECWLQYGAIAGMRHDWDAALARLAEAARRFPNHSLIAARLSETRLQAALARVDSGAVVETAATTASGPLTDRELMMSFEAIGSNCTFGFLQRFYDAEPIGLLRWAGVAIEHLSRALNERFAGVGEEQQTELIAEEGLNQFGQREFMTRDVNYGFFCHTFVPVSDSVDRADLLRKVTRRQRFMRDKLLRDLEEAEKLFVFKDDVGSPEDAVLALHQGMERYGRNRLFYVRREEPGRPAGTVLRVAPRLVFGYLDAAAVVNQAGAEGAWLTLCRQAHALLTEDA